jgi:hypothetical protein
MRMLVVSDSYQNFQNGAVSYQLTEVDRVGGGNVTNVLGVTRETASIVHIIGYNNVSS